MDREDAVGGPSGPWSWEGVALAREIVGYAVGGDNESEVPLYDSRMDERADSGGGRALSRWIERRLLVLERWAGRT